MTNTVWKRIAAAMFALALLGAGCSAPSSEADATRTVETYDAETFFKTLSVGGGSFSHDESKLLVSTDETGVFNAYSQPIDGGERTQLTHSDSNAIFALTYFPNDDRFLYTFDEGGNELNHVFVQEEDGSQKDLTPGEKLKANFAGWSGDKKSFYILTNERDPRYFDLYRYSADDYERKLMLKNEKGWSIAGISDDGKWAAMVEIHNNANTDIHLKDLGDPSSEPKHITPHEGDISHGVLTFTPDSRKLYYSTNEHGEWTQAWSYDLESGEREPVIQADWDVMFVNFSETGRYRVSGINADAKTAVTILDTKEGSEVALPEELPRGDVTGVRFSPSESWMAFYINSDTSPSNLHVYNLADGTHRQLTHSLNPKIDEGHLVEGRVVRYESFDGLEIPAIQYRPRQASADNPVPALVWVHGGPGGQSRKGYRAAIQHLVNHGYAVLAVNNRGSSGYGKTFHHMDDKKHGEVDLKDCVHARSYLETLDWVDGSKVGIIGGSYGGYMVAAALAFEPEAFDVGIDIFGVTNWVRTLSDIPPWWTSFREGLYSEMGDPAEEEERLRRISPLFHAENITKPLLVVQGANDPRVKKVESDELVEAVRNNGVPVEYVVFEDEGHGFRNRENRIEASEKYVQFLDKHLKGAG